MTTCMFWGSVCCSVHNLVPAKHHKVTTQTGNSKNSQLPKTEISEMSRLHLTFHNTFIHINSNHHLSRHILPREPQRLPSPSRAIPIQGLRSGGGLLQRQDTFGLHQLALPGKHLHFDPLRLPVDSPPEPAAAAWKRRTTG